MATLKICTNDRTQWLTDVRRVTELNSFSVPKSNNVTGDDILRAAFEGDHPNVINLVDFNGEPVGKVLGVSRGRDDDQVWVVPAGACFLMSDGGKTIDRI